MYSKKVHINIIRNELECYSENFNVDTVDSVDSVGFDYFFEKVLLH